MATQPTISSTTTTTSSNVLNSSNEEDPTDPLAGFTAGLSRSLARTIGNFSKGAIAGMAEESAGYPLDLVKTRIQVNQNANIGFLKVAKEVFQKEGVVGMFKGLSAPLLGSAAIAMVQFSTFEKTYVNLSEKYPNIPDTYRLIGAGSLAGLAQSVIVCPVDLIKNRMQVSGHGHGGSTIQTMKSIYKENRLRGFYTGFGATLLRDVPGMAVFFTTYESLKKKLGVDSSEGHGGGSFVSILVAGGVAGMAYHGSTHCFDMAKTLIQTQSSPPKYKGTFDCLRQIGIKGMFRGFTPSVIRSFPSNAAGLLVYELVQKFD
eukprot:gene810-1011_t